ncbi:MAG: DUF2752 domain-containing protein [Flavobacteriales bacterium]|nr:DUF2752 domain-containing protein [Flavobacteriales bacterium]
MNWRTFTVLVAATVLACIFYSFDPSQGGFLACPFHYFTGLLCPGCGSQRGLHDLLHGRFGDAFGHNALLVVSIPLLVLQWVVGRFLAGRALDTNNYVVYGWLVLVVGWWIARNLIA